MTPHLSHFGDFRGPPRAEMEVAGQTAGQLHLQKGEQ